MNTRRDLSGDGGIPPDALQAQVEKILASAGFANSERQRRLLRYLVSMSLAGRGSEIKEYALGVDLFGRGESFDPQTDAIVRTEVSRLRSKLRAYYSGEGRDDSLIVDLPVRSYAPVFKLQDVLAAAAPPPVGAHRRRWLWISTALLALVGLVSYGSYSLGKASARGQQAEDSEDKTSVAVLPFVNSAGDPDVEKFADGLTEEVIETLAEIQGVSVVSRTSAFQFKGKQVDLRTIAAALNVGAVLEGAVDRSGSRLRITTRLVNAAGGTPYYSHVYEHNLQDAFTIQMEIAGHVASALRLRKKGEEVARFTKNAEAHRFYLEGLYHANRVSEAELRLAIDCYQRAIDHDPNYSPAYTGLSDTYITLALLSEAPPREAMQRAAAAARSAVKTGDTYAHAHAALGSILALYEWNWPAAEKEFRKAIARDPNDSAIRQQYAMRYLAPQGNLDSALFELQLAQKFDPYSPQVMLNRGRLQDFKRDPERAIRVFQAALELDPQLETAPLAMAEAYSQKCLYEQASKTLMESSEPTEDEARLAFLGSVYGLSRQPQRARRILEGLEGVARHQSVSGYYVAQVYLALGDTDAALSWLEKAAEERSPLMVYVKVAPQFDKLRMEPRFVALLNRIGIQQ